MPIKLAKKNRTQVAILIDSSGSMGGLEKSVVKNFNSIVDAMKKSAAKTGQDVELSLYTFGGTVDTVFKQKLIEKVAPLTTKEYSCGAGTPMFDGIAKAINDMKRTDDGDPTTANILTVITDGQENQSTNANVRDVPPLIRQLQGTDRWTFTFLVPRGDERYVTGYGVPAQNIQAWDANEAGTKVMADQVANGYAQYLGLRSAGQTMTKGFFIAQVDAKQAAAAKRKLDDVAGDFHALTVWRDTAIQAFVENEGLPFQKGLGFYELTKAEKVQHNKEILLREHKSGKVYGGAQARAILGLPAGMDVKVKPGMHAGWDIFVQSTSNNRKLIGGTTLMYLK